MIERDYLMRQIMQLLEIIQKILQFRKKGDKEEAEKQVDFFYKVLRLEPDIRQLSVSRLVETLVYEKKLTNEQLEMVAFILKEQGEMTDDATARIDYFTKSYIILQKVDREMISYSMDRAIKMGELREYLGEDQQNPTTE